MREDVVWDGEKEEERGEGGDKTEVLVIKTALDLREDIQKNGGSRERERRG